MPKDTEHKFFVYKIWTIKADLYMNKSVRKTNMRRSALENNYYRDKLSEIGAT